MGHSHVPSHSGQDIDITPADLSAVLGVIGAYRRWDLPAVEAAASQASSTAALLGGLAYVAAATLDALDPADAEKWLRLLRAQTLAGWKG